MGGGDGLAERARLLLEDADELLADRLALLLGVGDPLEPAEEALARIDVDERHLEVATEGLDHLGGLVLAEEPVVDEHARELVADSLVDEQRGDGRVDAARERAEDALAPDLCPNSRRLLLDHSRGRPGRRRVRHVVEEVLEQLGAMRCVHDLGMELDAVERPVGVLERGDRGRRRAGDNTRPGWRRDDRITVAHPDGLPFGQAVEERSALCMQRRLAELGDAGPIDAPAEILGHELHAVADAEDRHAEVEQARIDPGRALRVDGGRPAREDERARVAAPYLLGGDPVRDELRVHTTLAHASRDQLRVLAAEVDDENGALVGLSVGEREPDDLAHNQASRSPRDSSETPS